MARVAVTGLAALLVGTTAEPAIAATATATFVVTATVQATCLVSVSGLAFGTYTGTQIDSTATITVTCTNATPFYVNIDGGLRPDGFYIPRLLGPGGYLVNYLIFQDLARSILWQNSYNVNGRGGTGTGSAQVLTAYARVYASQFGNPGSYTDTLVVTVTY